MLVGIVFKTVLKTSGVDDLKLAVLVLVLEIIFVYKLFHGNLLNTITTIIVKVPANLFSFSNRVIRLYLVKMYCREA